MSLAAPAPVQDAQRRTCKDCIHFDKSAFPSNPRFGRCTVPLELPPLPMWFDHDGNLRNARNVADYYDAVHCQTFQAKP